jgi:HAMP domain-containing protein
MEGQVMNRMARDTKQNEPMKKHFFVSLKVRLLIGFTVIFTLVFCASYYWFYSFTTDRAFQRIVSDMRSTLEGTVGGLSADSLLILAETGQANEFGFSDDPLYVTAIDWFTVVNNIEPRAWPYTYIRGQGENEVLFISDLWARHDQDRATGFRESYQSRGPLVQSLTGEPAYLVPIGERELTAEDARNPLKRFLNSLGLLRRVGYEDRWGQWVSAYAPIFDTEANVVGGVGIDFNANYVDNVQDAILAGTARAFGVTYAVLLLLVYLFSEVFTRPISKLTSFAEAIGEGNYDQDLQQLSKKRFNDEISKLAEVFEIMVGKVKKREESLKKEVVQLKIEIDEGKRQKQVDSIVDSDAFQDLKKRAQALRNRKQPTSTVDSDQKS